MQWSWVATAFCQSLTKHICQWSNDYILKKRIPCPHSHWKVWLHVLFSSSPGDLVPIWMDCACSPCNRSDIVCHEYWSLQACCGSCRKSKSWVLSSCLEGRPFQLRDHCLLHLRCYGSYRWNTNLAARLWTIFSWSMQCWVEGSQTTLPYSTSALYAMVFSSGELIWRFLCKKVRVLFAFWQKLAMCWFHFKS